MMRSMVFGLGVVAALVLSACGPAKEGTVESAPSTATIATIPEPSSPPSSNEGAEAPEGSLPPKELAPMPLNSNPLEGATPMASWNELVLAAESAAKANGLRVAIVDPRSVLGPNAAMYFNGLAASFVDTDLTIIEGLGATGDPFLDQLVSRTNASRSDPTLMATRVADGIIDCAMLPASEIDELLCGVAGTEVEFRIPHTDNSATTVQAMAHSVIPTMTWLNPSGKDHP